MTAPTNPDILRLGPEDVGALRALNVLFGEAFAERERYAAAPPSETYLTGLLANPSFIVLTASIGENLAAGLVAYELKKFERERSEIYIYDLAVSAAHRRKGIATTLIQHLKEVAAASGAYVIFVQADYVDPPAIALYTKLGLREDVLHFDIPVI
jgi:aminoglycoside 3-N-acetyltransferase I